MLYTALKVSNKWNDEAYKDKMREDYRRAHPTNSTIADLYSIAGKMHCRDCGHEWKENPFSQKKLSYCPACGRLQKSKGTDDLVINAL